MSQWQSQFRSSSEAKKAGWFSRRHETDAAHRQAQDARRIRMELRRHRENDALAKSVARKQAERVA